MYALADCNSFYASCEKVFRPDLWKRAVVVLSNNDGCVIARSPEAKALGIKMGEPYFLRQAFFKAKRVAVFSANFTLYGDLSARVMEVLRRFAPSIEVYSIDEAFLSLHGLSVNWGTYAAQIRQRVGQEVGIPISIGLAATKTLAKLANHLAKKQPSGVFTIGTGPKSNGQRWQSLPLSEVWGIGRRYEKKWQARGVCTVGDFMQLAEPTVQKQMGIVGVRTYRELHGHACLSLEQTVPAKKAICTSRSFGKPLQSLGELEEALCTFAANAAGKLRKQRSNTGFLSVFVETNRFKPELPQYNNSMGMRLPWPTDSTLTISRYARFLLKKLYRTGYTYKKTGILLTDFVPLGQQQQNLFQPPTDLAQDKLMKCLDHLAQKYGRQVLKVGSEGMHQPFKMRQQHLSNRYTTHIGELLEIG